MGTKQEFGIFFCKTENGFELAYVFVGPVGIISTDGYRLASSCCHGNRCLFPLSCCQKHFGGLGVIKMCVYLFAILE